MKSSFSIVALLLVLHQGLANECYHDAESSATTDIDVCGEIKQTPSTSRQETVVENFTAELLPSSTETEEISSKKGVPTVQSSNFFPEVASRTESRVLDRENKAGITCLQAVDTSCKAFAILDILDITGTCGGTLSADCKAVTESIREFRAAFNEWYVDGGACDRRKTEVAATAVAKAIAKVWANAFGKLTCEGQAFSCGWDFHHGEHWSIAFAEAIAHASAEARASPGVSVAGFCFADIRALSKEISEAVLEARADLCGARGTTEDVKNAFVSAAQSRIAVAFARSTAEACSADEELIASSVCSGVADSNGEGDIFEVGDPCAGGTGTKICRGPGNEMCCNRGFRRFLCPCQRKGCAHGPWLKKSEFNAQGSQQRTFLDREGTLCSCQ